MTVRPVEKPALGAEASVHTDGLGWDVQVWLPAGTVLSRAEAMRLIVRLYRAVHDTPEGCITDGCDRFALDKHLCGPCLHARGELD